MTRHQIASRADNFVVGVISAVALVSLLAYSQNKDVADGKAAQVQVQKQIRGEVRGAGK